MTVKRRRAYKIQDLHVNEYETLKTAYFLQQNQVENKPIAFVCFGSSYFKLLQLDLIDNENQITITGRQLVKFLSARM